MAGSLSKVLSRFLDGQIRQEVARIRTRVNRAFYGTPLHLLKDLLGQKRIIGWVAPQHLIKRQVGQ